MKKRRIGEVMGSKDAGGGSDLAESSCVCVFVRELLGIAIAASHGAGHGCGAVVAMREIISVVLIMYSQTDRTQIEG